MYLKITLFLRSDSDLEEINSKSLSEGENAKNNNILELLDPEKAQRFTFQEKSLNHLYTYLFI